MSNRVLAWLRWAVRALLLLAALGLLTMTLLPIAGSDAWWVRYPVYPALQIAAAMGAVALLLLFWRGWLDWIAIAALIAGIAVQASRLLPYVAPLVTAWPAPTVPGGTCAPGDRLRVLEVNVQRTNRHDHTLLEMVRALDPDVAWFQEVNGWWESELSGLQATMPYGESQVRENYFGVHLYSKLTLSDSSVQELTKSNNPSVFTTVTLPSGRAVRLYAIHPRPPQVGQSTAERDAQLMATALAAHDDQMPHLMLGDLNSVPWASEIARLTAIGRVEDPRIGRGLFITWNAKRIVAKWPLDHILPGLGIALADLRVMPAFGSDHRPLLADLCVTGSGGTPAALDPAVRAAAEATVARGQGKALGPGARRPEGTETKEKED